MSASGVVLSSVGVRSRADLVVGRGGAARTVPVPSRVSFLHPSRVSFPHMFELRCAELHSVRCDVRLSAPDLEGLVILAREHGASAHGFTPAWYSSGRLAAMAEVVTQCCG
jgi:hypothetical protein